MLNILPITELIILHALMPRHVLQILRCIGRPKNVYRLSLNYTSSNPIYRWYFRCDQALTFELRQLSACGREYALVVLLRGFTYDSLF